MAQCRFTSKKLPVCKGRARAGSEFCNFHQPKGAQTASLEEPEESVGERPGQRRAPDPTPRIGAAALLAGREERKQERQRHTAPEMPTGYQVSAEEVGARLAVMLHTREEQARDELRRRGKPSRDKDGYRLDDGDPAEARRPIKMLTRRQRPDATRIIDPVTKEPPASLKQGWQQRWVSTVDAEGRPIEKRVAEFEDYDYEFVLDAAGHPIEGRFGVAMQGPPEAYAARMLDYSLTGALRTKNENHEGADGEAQAASIAQAINRKYGDEVVSVVAERDHGTRQSAVPLGREELYDV